MAQTTKRIENNTTDDNLKIIDAITRIAEMNHPQQPHPDTIKAIHHHLTTTYPNHTHTTLQINKNRHYITCYTPTPPHTHLYTLHLNHHTLTLTTPNTTLHTTNINNPNSLQETLNHINNIHTNDNQQPPNTPTTQRPTLPDN